MKNTQAAQEKIDFAPFGPYRFIGKSVYARSGASDNDRGSGDLFGALWKQSGWVFDELDALKEYASDEPHNAALMTWDAYTPEDKHLYGITVGKTQLIGYCVGRFMKPDAPVPAGFDYIDIPAGIAAKGWTKGKAIDFDLDGRIRDAIERTENYRQASWRFMAEIYPKPDENGVPEFGYYMSCEPLNEQQIAERKKAAARAPSIEDDINELLESEMRATALRLAAFLRENHLMPKRSGKTGWKVPFEECYLCDIRLEKGKWAVQFFDFRFGNESGDGDTELIKLVQEHVAPCKSCHSPCTGGNDATIFGKAFENTCSQLTLPMDNPDDRALESIKKLIVISKKVAPHSEAWHCHHG